MSDFFTILEKNHKEASTSIKHMIDVDAQEFCSYKEAATLCKFIFETENKYGLLQNPEHFYGFYNNAQAFASLCNTIYHAICDDGEIAYAMYKSNPVILFKSRWEITEQDFSNPDMDAIDEFVKEFREKQGLTHLPEPVIIFYKDAYEFIEAVKAYEIEAIQKSERVQDFLKSINENKFKSFH